MRIKKIFIVGALALATTGCVSAYTYAAAPNATTKSSIDTSKDSAKIKADSESTTEAKENANENTKSDAKSTKDDFEDNESTDSKETIDDSENEDVNVDDKDSAKDADESEDVTEPYEVIQDGDENDAICEHTWGAEQGGYDSEKGYFYWREYTKCGQQKLDRYVSEEEFLKNDPDYNEPSKDTNTTETDDSADSNAENNVITTENNN